MKPPTQIAHVVFGTHRYAEMVHFYRTLFDARVKSSSTDAISFLTYDEEHHRLAIVDLGPEQSTIAQREPGSGLRHIAFSWDTVGDLMNVYRQARDVLGVVPTIATRHGASLSMYYDDPDGNRIELQVDTLDAEAADAFMSTDAFRSNPLGQPFDPEELVGALSRGEPIDHLILRDDQPQGSHLTCHTHPQAKDVSNE